MCEFVVQKVHKEIIMTNLEKDNKNPNKELPKHHDHSDVISALVFTILITVGMLVLSFYLNK